MTDRRESSSSAPGMRSRLGALALLGALTLFGALAPAAAEACTCREGIDVCPTAELIVAVEIREIETTGLVDQATARVLTVARGEAPAELRLEWDTRSSCTPMTPEPGARIWVVLPDADDLRIGMCRTLVRPMALENIDEAPCDAERQASFGAALHSADVDVHASRAGCGSCAVGAHRSPAPLLLAAIALLGFFRRRRERGRVMTSDGLVPLVRPS